MSDELLFSPLAENDAKLVEYFFAENFFEAPGLVFLNFRVSYKPLS